MGISMNLPPRLRLSFEKDPSWEDREIVDEGLGTHNAPFLRDPRYSYFGIFVRDDARETQGAIRAGLVGNCYAGWLFVNLLWVHRDLRRRGIGQMLLAEAERHAIEFGCHSAWLDTFSFQAPDFYPKFGYQEFARLDYPPDHQRIFLKKQLNAG
jgi:GNAT superfamily N-acetyltransferase